MANMLMSVSREEALEFAIDCVRKAQIDMAQISDGNVDDDSVMDATSVVRGWIDVADTWISIAKELPGEPRPNGDRSTTHVAHTFPEGPVRVRVEE